MAYCSFFIPKQLWGEIDLKYFDLSQMISTEMPVYPGTEAPIFMDFCTIAKHGFNETKITFYTHTGTHLDAPAHLLKDGLNLKSLAIEHFIGKGLVIDCTDLSNGEHINLLKLMSYREQLLKTDFVLFYTAWSKKWGSNEYFKNFPVLDEKAAEFLSSLNIKGVGIDAISVDPVDAEDFVIHKKFLSKNIIIIENLTNLDKLIDISFNFTCFPLNLDVKDGSPVRAVAFFE